MRYINAKNIKFVITRFVFSTSECTKIRFRPGSTPDPAGVAYDAPPDPLPGWGGEYPLPAIPPRSTPSASRTRRVGSQAPSTQNPGYASAGNKAYCYVELTVSSLAVVRGRNHHQYSLRLPTEGWLG